MASEAWLEFHAGERWRYRAPPGFANSRILIGAVLCFREAEPLVACAVTDAAHASPDGSLESVTIPFLPMTVNALAQTVVARDGSGDLPPGFAAEFQAWQEKPNGLIAFTVPFEGRLDLLIAHQMAVLVNSQAP